MLLGIEYIYYAEVSFKNECLVSFLFLNVFFTDGIPTDPHFSELN